jgi:hypothetical protein
VLRLLPGETYTAKVPLLSTVPLEKRCPGVYAIRAVFAFNGLCVCSEPLRVELGK